MGCCRSARLRWRLDQLGLAPFPHRPSGHRPPAVRRSPEGPPSALLLSRVFNSPLLNRPE
eukprot:12746332-Alexandrium_andersonii.AAC.1